MYSSQSITSCYFAGKKLACKKVRTSRFHIKGFTLVELLVVIAILAGLGAILVPNYMEARIRARDTQRKNDIKQIQKALELYKLNQTPPAYPTGTSGNGLPTAGSAWTVSGVTYMNKFPADPVPTTYQYRYVRNAIDDYDLCTCLENNADTQGATCAAPCSGQCGSLTKCFSVTEP